MVPEYKGMLALSKRFSGTKFEMVLFPCNQFMLQEPGTEKAIADFVLAKHGIVSGVGGFNIMSKSQVNGKHTNATYTYLKGQPGCEGNVAWNFKGKFLVQKDGSIVALRNTLALDCIPAIDEALSA
mmetsp:Transcript_52618/g.125282  ORF Transcript_52618/g.125282 Transcript_52618/m.125282 type:complete len:126 (+) Transcript_52618:93-470(+)